MIRKYLKESERRKYPRFSELFFENTGLSLKPVPPLYGEPVTGHLIDLSAGGMALLLHEALPRRVFLKMTLTFPDGFRVESVVHVCHISSKGPVSGYLHGIEFLNPSPEAVEKINIMAQDSLLCQQRVDKNDSNICHSDCSLYSICHRRSRYAAPAKAIKMALEPVDDLPAWSSFKAEFIKRNS